jgi:hypothetical protein
MIVGANTFRSEVNNKSAMRSTQEHLYFIYAKFPAKRNRKPPGYQNGFSRYVMMKNIHVSEQVRWECQNQNAIP